MSQPAKNIINDSVRAYYEFWVSETAKVPEHPAPPNWDELGADQVIAWSLALAASIEFTTRIATAITATVAP